MVGLDPFLYVAFIYLFEHVEVTGIYYMTLSY